MIINIAYCKVAKKLILNYIGKSGNSKSKMASLFCSDENELDGSSGMKICSENVSLDLLPPDILRTMETLHASKFGVWLVGGALRDLFLGRVPEDWDIATDATPEQVMGLFPRVVPVGIRHGTVQVLTKGMEVEVTSLGISGTEGIIADLGRRDFTVNAMALSYPAGALLDPYKGRQDLRSLTLRAVGDERSRFQEDPLRVLRAGRFMSVYGFRVRHETFCALKAEAEGLATSAQERIRHEVSKMLTGEHVANALEQMRRGGVLLQFLPELDRLHSSMAAQPRHCGWDAYGHTLMTLHHAPCRLRVRLTALFHRIADSDLTEGMPHPASHGRNPGQSARVSEVVMTRWRMSRGQIHSVLTLVKNQIPLSTSPLSDVELRRLIVRVGLDLLEDLLDVALADRLACIHQGEAHKEFRDLGNRIRQQLEADLPMSISDLAVNGRDVMRVLGLEPGALVGKVLRRLFEEVIEDPGLNKHEILMDFLREKYHKDRLDLKESGFNFH